MNEKQAKKLVGNDNWEDFLDFMQGQTVGISKNGDIDYYKWDVERYIENKVSKRVWWYD